ncbi:MAG: hypothetical protein KDB79_14425, partial [Acidobacteria bacterium]|nr:hypothetical protein [Acidobacteriota bacterium]
SETHKLAFDFEKKTRQNGVEAGRLNGNPVHQGFIQVVEKRPPDFSINTVVNKNGSVVDLYCGDWKLSHEKACEDYGKSHTLKIAEKRDVVIVSCGGNPHDTNMIQAHKALEMASHACNPGGKIIFLAKCEDGLGREDFIDWFSTANSESLAERLCQNYKVNGQTAWSLLMKTESFDIEIMTDLPRGQLEKLGLRKILSLEKALESTAESSGYIVPFGSKFKITAGD